MGRTIGAAAILVLTASAVASSASARPSHGAGSLELNAIVNMTRMTASAEQCPPGAPPSALCSRYTGESRIRGLGRVTSTYTKVITSMTGEGCEVSVSGPVLQVANKGSFELSTTACWPFRLPTNVGPFEFRVIGGSQAYAGASGTLTFVSSVFATPPGARDTWTGTLVAPGVEFDLTPPVLGGLRSRVVRAPKKAKRVRVRFTVTAQDGVDGRLPVTCAPRAGSFFRVGRTRVRCSAEDSSLNLATGSFTVTVKRRR